MPTNQFYASFDSETIKPRPAHEGEYRNPFQIDRDRIFCCFRPAWRLFRYHGDLVLHALTGNLVGGYA